MDDPREIQRDCEAIMPALKAWFASQGISEKRQATLLGVMLGQSIGNTATSIERLGVGLALMELAIEMTAKDAFVKKMR